MKNINKIQLVLVLLLGITFTSCETTDLDLLNDPNQITLENGDLERYLVAIQVDFANFVEAMGRNGAQLTRIEQLGSPNYFNAFDPTSTNFEWGLAYQGMFSDMKAAEEIALENGNFKHIGVMKILKAYTLFVLVDYFGDVPLSEATNLEEFPNPNVDDDAAVYAAALELLDEGIIEIRKEALGIETDLFYGNDFEKWEKLANTLKMNAYVNTRLVDGNAANNFNAIVNSGNFIFDSADDFQFNWDIVNNNQIDSRHPAYRADYQAAGAGRYRSNWLMDQMLQDDDPRRRYFFFRQNDCTPGGIGVGGESCPNDPERLFCSTDSPPSHYPGSMVFCWVDGGYWGRDHGFGGGIPPDTFRRTTVGIYPAAGNFDDNRFSSVGLEQGGQGAGITPGMLASWAHLMVAEMSLISGNVGGANTSLQTAMQIHIDKVMSFGSKDPEADLSFAPTSEEVSNYISATGDAFANAGADDRWEIFALQHFKAHYGNGTDSYNFYRRVGFPKSLQFNIEQNPGNFVRSFLYPADEANTNSNISQKSNVDNQVFWDTNPSSPGFPSAN
jgi:hypothetical protein